MHLINFVAFVVPKFAKVWDIYFTRKCCEIKPTVNFGASLNRKDSCRYLVKLIAFLVQRGLYYQKSTKIA